jgi:hypothetical protein
MKKFIFSSIIIFSLILQGCEDNFDPKIYGSLSSTNFPQTESDYESYLMIGYLPLSGIWGYSFSDWNMPFYSVEGGVIKFFDATSDYNNPALIHNWGSSYLEWSAGNFANATLYSRGSSGTQPSHFEKVREITRLTKIIGAIHDATTISATKQKELEGEARLLRGIMMYYMLHIYGPVPVIIDPALIGNAEAERNMVRPDLEQIVQWIYDDLDYAQQNMTNSAPNGRYTADYARFFLMKHCLNEGAQHNEFYDKAIALYQALKASDKHYDLFTDGNNPFVEQFKQGNKFNKEIIMAMSVSKDAEGDKYGDFFPVSFYVVPSDAAKYDKDGKPTPFELQGPGWEQVYNVAPAFYDTYENGDKRKEVILTSYSVDNAERTLVTRADIGVKWDGFIVNKYPIEIVNPYQPTDFPLSRWADVLLMYAEAVARKTSTVPTGEAMVAITEVRARAGLGALQGAATTNFEDFMEALLLERGHEFLYEGHRKIDLIRFNKFRHNLKEIKNVEPTNQYIPIPDYAVRQAEGYGKTLTQEFERPDYGQDR